MGAAPIFLHAWWRSGSTYTWSKFRQDESLICYYEPLHEKILHLTLEEVEGPADPELARVFRHPVQDKNYSAEYASLLRSNSLRFSAALSYDRFLLRPD